MNKLQNLNHLFKTVGKVFILVLFLALIIPSGNVQAADEEITIGSLMCMSGDLASYGPPVNKGILLAKDHLNEAGGILGKKINIKTRDTKTEPTSGVDAAKKLVKVDGVPAFVGAMSSAVSLSVAESVAIPNKVVQISPASTNPQIAELDDDDYVYRTTPSDAIQGPVIGQLALDLGYESLSIVYVNNDYGKGLADSAGRWFEERGGEVLAKVPFEKGKASYRGELQQATKQDPGVLILVAYPENGINVLRQSISGGYIDEFIFSDGMQAPEIIEGVGPKYLNGTYGTVPGSRETPSANTFKESYTEKYGSTPPKPYMDTAYDATVIIGLAMQKGGSSDSKTIRDNLRNVANPPGEKVFAGPEGIKKALKLIDEGKDINYEGAAGTVNFNDDGDVVSPINVWKIEDGEIVTDHTEEIAVQEGRFVPAKVLEEEEE